MPDDRTYIKLHDGMPDHPKVDGLPDAAFRLLVTMWCWCSRHRTDGFVPTATWTKRGTARARSALLAAGLARPVEGGVQMHDYLEHQRSAAEIAELKERRREAGSKGGKVKAGHLASARDGAKQSAKQMPKQTRSKPVADTEEVPNGTSQTDPPGGGEPPHDTAGTIIAEYIERCPGRPVGQVLAQLGKHIKAMLAEGVDPDDIRRGMAIWMRKDHHPSVLPSIVNSVINTPNGYRSQTDANIAALLSAPNPPQLLAIEGGLG